MEPLALAPTLYEVLGVSESVSVDEVRQLRRRLARRYHPDVAEAPDPERLAAILDACAVLGDSQRRAGYDARLAGVRRDRSASSSATHARRPAPRTRRPVRFPWHTALLQACVYGLGAATVPGYVTAYWIGSDLSTRAAQSSPHVLLFDGPIVAVLLVQALLAVAVVMLVHATRYRAALRVSAQR